jgi:hypothetical protein
LLLQVRAEKAAFSQNAGRAANRFPNILRTPKLIGIG